MNREQKQMIVVVVKVLFVVLLAFLYQYGGYDMKWMRRFLAPFLAALGCYLYSFNVWYWYKMPVQMLTLCLGYGGDTMGAKLLRRGIFGAANGGSSIIGMHSQGYLPVLMVFQGVLVLAASIAFGVFNPFPNARIEEFVIGFMIFFLPVMACKGKHESE